MTAPTRRHVQHGSSNMHVTLLRIVRMTKLLSLRLETSQEFLVSHRISVATSITGVNKYVVVSIVNSSGDDDVDTQDVETDDGGHGWVEWRSHHYDPTAEEILPIG